MNKLYVVLEDHLDLGQTVRQITEDKIDAHRHAAEIDAHGQGVASAQLIAVSPSPHTLEAWRGEPMGEQDPQRLWAWWERLRDEQWPQLSRQQQEAVC